MKRSTFLAVLLCALGSVSRADQTQSIRLIVTDDGHYLLQGQAVDDAELKKRLIAIAKKYKNIDFHLVGDERADHGRVAEAMRIAQQAGMPLKIGYITAPESRSASAAAR
jgi:biopolymer transport protein ExbD